MLRLIKWLILLIILGGIGLTGYAYIGPYFGVDFTPDKAEIRTPVVLDAD
ncbi:hypothetical protein [Pseudooceanicola nitratireducens]|jgi:hypothetical protein|uniref:Uncharacterized protein n=1 Tax=Pseudooceanicola nitratireducens TaxID=517719 RepID=A0A1I1L6A0_9RHOB|nr:hypothetical protein [Pseudooceanicola nitratireducens]MEC7299189.1 hypothetical protein [Pseudomonadota bacterium]MBY6158843.1 hypothetical protein [Pseudooceanicola nitratireducens]MEC7794835.1 hypothetical protein [Pseudomonadota bacterium]MEC8667738.1 hypothetical protein [Pseudomonadota bacterium]MEC9104188.1 hypothetical protein [Pseudomonadota bacterium]